MDYIDQRIIYESNFPYNPVLQGIKAVDDTATLNANIKAGDTSGVASFINSVTGAINDTKSSTSSLTSILSNISSVVTNLKDVRQRQADAQKKAEIDAYISQLESQVEEAERKLAELRRATWIKIGLVVLGCVAVGSAAYIALKRK